MKDFKLIDKFLGYQNKKDVSNTDARFLITGSYDVLVHDGEKIVTRPGMTLDGQANSDRYPTTSSCDWDSSLGVEHRLRVRNGILEYRYKSSTNVVTWNTLKSGFATTAKLRFAPWWSSAEVKDLLLFVDGTSNIYMWSGGRALVASNTATTLTKSGSETWAESGFLLAGTRKVVVGGVEYAYTGGEGTTTLTGLSGLPAFTAGDIVIQAVITNANKPASGVSNDLIWVAKNQVYIADEQQQDTYVSKNTDYKDFTFSSPRIPGEGAVLTLDSCPTAIIDQEDAVYISAGKNDWYEVKFTLSADLTNETMTIEKLKSGPQQSAINQELVGKIKNSVIYVSHEPTLDSLGRVENINTPQSKPLSDPIKIDFNEYDFSGAMGGHVKFYKDQTFISIPAQAIVLIFDHANSYWQPPQRMSISRFSIIDDELYGHSSVVSETYKIFDEEALVDNGDAIMPNAVFAYRNFDKRAWKKNFDEFFHEGYIAEGTVIQVNYKFEYQGSSGEQTKFIRSDNSKTIFGTGSNDNSLGKNSLGKQPLGTQLTDSSFSANGDLLKFRTIHTLKKDAFYEMLLIYSSDTAGFKWQILAQGPNALLSTSDNIDIKT